MGKWKETAWKYEKYAGDPTEAEEGRRDALASLGVGALVRHEAEHWEFHPDHTLEIVGPDRGVTHYRWVLKGRGHILFIRHENGSEETYDVKELNRDELVLNFNIGMELKGIARLDFTRVGTSRNR